MSAVARTRLTALVAVFAAAAPAAASFHVMRLFEVYGGDLSHPDAQYVELRMCTAGQNFVAGHSIEFFDALGGPLGSATFTAPVLNGTDQARILIATSTAETAFGIVADLRMPAALLVAGGKVCFDPPPSAVDCMAWGNYAVPDPTVGNPFSPTGFPAGQAAIRDMTPDGSPTALECSPVGANDDSDDSAADFDAGPPAPVNNQGAAGSLDPVLVFLHGFESGAFAGWSAVLP